MAFKALEKGYRLRPTRSVLWLLWYEYEAKSLVMGTGSTEDQYGAMVATGVMLIDHKDIFCGHLVRHRLRVV